MSRRDSLWLIVLAAVVLAFMAFVPPDDSVERDAAQYCQMVHDHRWPDFHRVYTQQCNKDGTVNEDYIHGR